MAIFSKLVTTQNGRALIARMLSGEEKIVFTKVRSSDTEYTLEELENLVELTGIKQTNSVSKVSRTNPVSVKVETVFTNTELTEGYHMRTVALYAQDGDGEILYAAAIETSGNCYMPAFGGTTVSGAYIQLVTTVSNAENVTLEVDNSVFATIGDIRDLQGQIDSIGELVSSMAGTIGTNMAKLDLADKIGYLVYVFPIVHTVRYPGNEWTYKIKDDKYPKLNDKTYYMYVLSGNFLIQNLGELTEIYEGVIWVTLFVNNGTRYGQWLPISRGVKGTYCTAPVHIVAAGGPANGNISVSAQTNFIYKRGENNEAVEVEGSFEVKAIDMSLYIYKLGGLFSTVPESGFTLGSGLGGSDNYNLLKNKPSINNVTLQGNLTTEQLGIEAGIGGTEEMTYDEALAILNGEEEASES